MSANEDTESCAEGYVRHTLSCTAIHACNLFSPMNRAFRDRLEPLTANRPHRPDDEVANVIQIRPVNTAAPRSSQGQRTRGVVRQVRGEGAAGPSRKRHRRAGATRKGKGERKAKAGVFAKAGVIEEVVVQNIACHDNKRFVLHPNGNVIIGRNGSGKTALLSAIMLAFGARGAAARRNVNIANHVKHGKKWALVRVKLLNKGDNSFNADRYGEYITVERKITLTKPSHANDPSNKPISTYKIFNQNDESMMPSKMAHEEISNLAAHFGIQVTNPAVILTQGKAKTFLSSVTLEELYQRFADATSISDREAAIEKFKTQHEKNRMELKIMKKTCEKMKNEFKTLDDKYNDSQNAKATFDANKRALRQYKGKEKWLRVKNLQTRMEEVKVQQNDFKKLHRELEKIKDQAKQLGERLEKLIEQGPIKTKNLGLEIKDVKKKLKISKKDLRAANRSRDERKTILINEQKQMRKLEAKISELTRRQGQLQGGPADKAKLQAEAQKLDKEIERKSKRFYTLERELKAKRDKLNETDERALRGNIGRLEVEVKNLQSGDTLAQFGQHASAVDTSIDSNRSKFGVRPLGPLGRFVRVPSEHKDRLPHVEMALGHIMRAYLVDNFNDRKALREILRNFYGANNVPSVITLKKGEARHTIVEKDTNIRQERVVDLFKIDDDWVYNACIDQCSPEFQYLFDNSDEAYRFVRRAPENRRVIIVKDLSLIQRYGQSISRRPRKGRDCVSKYLNVDPEASLARLKELREELARHKRETKELEGLHKMKTDAERLLKDAEEKSRSVKEQLDRLDENDDGQSEHMNYLIAEQSDLKEMLDEQRERVEHLEDDLADERRAIDKLQSKVDGLINDKKSLEQKLNAIPSDISDARRLVEEQEECKRETELKIRKSRILNLPTRLKNIIHELKAALVEAKALIAEEPDLDPSDEGYIQNRIHNLLQKQEKLRKTYGDVSLIKKERDKMKLEKEKSESDLKEAQIRQDKFTEALDQRKRSLKEFRDECTDKVTRHFEDYTKRKPTRVENTSGSRRPIYLGSESKIIINHDEKTLKLRIQPDEGGPVFDDLTKLSGGQRSFTQLLLLMSLTTCKTSPIFAMDEADVCIDQRAQDQGFWKILLAYIDRFSQKQWIILTPQDTVRRITSRTMKRGYIQIQELAPPRSQEQTPERNPSLDGFLT